MAPAARLRTFKALKRRVDKAEGGLPNQCWKIFLDRYGETYCFLQVWGSDAAGDKASIDGRLTMSGHHHWLIVEGDGGTILMKNHAGVCFPAKWAEPV